MTDDKTALQFGIAGGGIYILLTFGYYLIDRALLVSAWKPIPFLLVLGMVIYASWRERKEVKGGISFKEMLRFSFIVYLAALLMTELFNYALYNYIDPELLMYMKEAMIENFKKTAELSGQSEETQQQIEQYRNQDFTLTFGTMLRGLLRWIIVGFIYCSIIAAFFRKSEPQEY